MIDDLEKQLSRKERADFILDNNTKLANRGHLAFVRPKTMQTIWLNILMTAEFLLLQFTVVEILTPTHGQKIRSKRLSNKVYIFIMMRSPTSSFLGLDFLFLVIIVKSSRVLKGIRTIVEKFVIIFKVDY